MTLLSPLFLDIETVTCVRDFEALPVNMQALWYKKAGFLGGKTDEEKQALFTEKGGIFAEFGKIVVIAIGYVGKDAQGKEKLHVQGLANDDEKALLTSFKEILKGFPGGTLLCGHNSKEFDIPYLCRRLIVHHISLPTLLDTRGKKPWEVNHIDTMELWKFGDYKHYTSLNMLTTLLGIPSSKEDMGGDEVHGYYYEQGDLASIERYCIKDVVATAQLYRRLRLLPLIDEANMVTKPSMEAQEDKVLSKGTLPLF